LLKIKVLTLPKRTAMRIKVYFSLLLVLLLAACKSGGVQQTESCAMYYWRTTLQLSSKERTFLRQHHVERLYLRYFDVVNDEAEGPLPNATLSFEDSLPQGVEIVPVVYLHNDCMRQPQPELADRILKRVLQMNETNGVGKLKELQIDCDWTMTTRRNFFSLMKQLQEKCHGRNIVLSATIRLHQLSQPVPPADRGVLMVYNTGDVTKIDVEKPILDLRDVRPYLHLLKDYRLDLSAAYPLFTWQVLFRAGKFVGIMHGDDDLPVLSGDSIVTRQPSLEDILSTRKAIADIRPDVHREVILYDLSIKNIRRFNSNSYDKIFMGN
jgi:hypothetical protein